MSWMINLWIIYVFAKRLNVFNCLNMIYESNQKPVLDIKFFEEIEVHPTFGKMRVSFDTNICWVYCEQNKIDRNTLIDFFLHWTLSIRISKVVFLTEIILIEYPWVKMLGKNDFLVQNVIFSSIKNILLFILKAYIFYRKKIH